MKFFLKPILSIVATMILVAYTGFIANANTTNGVNGLTLKKASAENLVLQMSLKKDTIIPKRRPTVHIRTSSGSSRSADFSEGFNESDFNEKLSGEGCFLITDINTNTIDPSSQLGSFSDGVAGVGLELDRGIVLTTGTVSEAFTSNSVGDSSEGADDSSLINDSDLDAQAIYGFPTFNEAIVIIDFTVSEGVDGFKIPFQFASEEYNEYVCSTFNDVFSVFIKGPGIPEYQSISLVPGSTTPLSINYVNNGSCGSEGTGEDADLSKSDLFIDNSTSPYPLGLEFDGITKTLFAIQNGLQAGDYQLKLAIADVGDEFFDSAVFFGAMSATSGGMAISCPCSTNPLLDPAGDCDGDGVINSEDQCPNTLGTAPTGCLDFDSDGVSDQFDIDDDNDGILDHIESPECFVSAEEVVITNITSTLTNYNTSSNSFSNLYNGIMDDRGPTGVNRTDAVGESVYEIELSARAELLAITVHYDRSMFRANATYKWQAWDGSGWIDVSDVEDGFQLNHGSKRDEFIETNSVYSKYRVTGVSGETWRNRLKEITIELRNYNPSYNPISECSLIDLNHQNLDSDGDGCSDAFEARATTDNTPGFAFTSSIDEGDSNSNGLADEVEEGTTGQINYTSSYSKYALDTNKNICDCLSETDCDGDGFPDDLEEAGICGVDSDMFDYNSPFEHWETTEFICNSDDSSFKLELIDGVQNLNSSPISHLKINPGHTLRLSADLIVKDLTISTESKLVLNGNKITIHGDLIVDGEVVHERGHIHFLSDFYEQQIAGSSTITLHEVTIENPNGVRLGTDMRVSGPLHPEIGQFNINGNSLELISLPMDGSVTTGSIGEIKPEADVIGDITIERYVESLEDGYRLLGLPIKGLSIADIAEDMVTTGFEGSNYPNHYFTNLKYYQEDDRTEEDISSGFKDVQSVTDVWKENQGYWAYFPPSADNVVFDATGEFNKGEIVYELSYTSSDIDQNDGWHCIVNPYPSAIDLNSDCITFNNVSKAIYILDHTTGGTWRGEYVSYNDGVSVNGGTNEIASSQAFMVQATGAGATITFNECAKTDEQGIFYRSSGNDDKSLIRMALQRGEDTYETVVRFIEDATTSFDPEYDARRWQAEMFSLASVLDGDTLSLNAIPLDQEELQIPLLVSVPEPGTYQLAVTEVLNLEPNYCIYVEDLETGDIMFIEEGATLTLVSEEANYYAERYMLNYKSVAEVVATAPGCTDEDSGTAEVTLRNQSEGSFTWYDDKDNLLLAETGNSSRLEEVESGIYIVEVTSSNEMCGSASIEVEVPAKVPEIIEISSTPDYCSSAQGSLKVNVPGAEQWSVSIFKDYELVDESTSSSVINIENLEGGIYDMVVETACATTEHVLDLSDPNAVKANFESPGELIIQDAGVEVEIESLSENADQNQWYLDEFFKGEEDIISLTFDQIGSYKLRLNSSNSRCEDDYEQEIMVSAASTIEEHLDKDFLTINKEMEINIIRLNDRSGRVDITLYDIRGNKIREHLGTIDSRVSINKQGLSSGVYILEIRTEKGEVMSSKYAH